MLWTLTWLVALTKAQQATCALMQKLVGVRQWLLVCLACQMQRSAWHVKWVTEKLRPFSILNDKYCRKLIDKQPRNNPAALNFSADCWSSPNRKPVLIMREMAKRPGTTAATDKLTGTTGSGAPPANHDKDDKEGVGDDDDDDEEEEEEGHICTDLAEAMSDVQEGKQQELRQQPSPSRICWASTVLMFDIGNAFLP
ncbi:hypothetical protein BKA62DRAFT_814620 [Auriculariales sp. MPI-PUGE-AT-0066]|nr:hypothetical protein BKA62DRAFT_814620 [Auriculariales sp. MPI-PUGE-AT-0066]